MKRFISVIKAGISKPGIFKPGILLGLALMSSNVYAADYDAVITLPPAQEFSLPVSAMVEKVNVSAGQKLKKGDEIIVLDQAPFVAANKQAKANVVIQQSRLKEAQRDLEHHRELYDRTVLSTVDLENVEMREKRARAHLAEAKAQQEVAEYELSYSKLSAPYDALVLSVHVNPGQYLNSRLQSQPVVSLVEQGRYMASLNLSAKELSAMGIGKNVTVQINDKSYNGTISGINYLGPDVTVEFSAIGDLFLVGEKAKVQID
jgi:RND family efflux transporter MFP subunit